MRGLAKIKAALGTCLNEGDIDVMQGQAEDLVEMPHALVTLGHTLGKVQRGSQTLQLLQSMLMCQPGARLSKEQILGHALLL